MASTNKISFAVSVTPKIYIDEVDNTNAAVEVMHESIRKTVGGSGISLSTAASAVDVVPYFVQSADNILLGAVQKAFS